MNKTRGTWVKWLWRVPAIVVLVLVFDLIGSASIRQFQRTRSEQAILEAELSQEPYRTADWGRAYWEELSHYDGVWEPFVVYRAAPMRGRYINVVNGVRRTYQTPNSTGARRPIVFIFGGSAAWGHGARDEGTLPSWLARVAEERGEPLEVRNYAESGWVNWQGIAYLAQLIADGERPDVVVFYSGVNEMLSGRRWPALRRPIWDGDFYPQAMAELNTERHRPLTRAWQFYRNTSFVMSALFGGYAADTTPTPSVQVLVPKIASEYSADRALVENIGKAYGFSTLFVWQVTVADKKSLSPQERTYAGWLPQTPESKPTIEWWSMPANLKDEYDGAGAEAIRRGAVSLSGAFDGMSESAFIDWMHPSEAGNERIARALYERVSPLLKSQDLRAASAEPQNRASLTADPATSVGHGKVRATISWATRDGSVAEVWVSINGGIEILFAGQSTHGSQNADWIESGSTYDFRLYAGTDHKVLLSHVLVTRLAPADAGR